MFKFEKVIWDEEKLAIGMDEVGRGAFAGPLGVGSVIFPSNICKKYDSSKLIIRDSKKMTELQRNKAFVWIIENCLDWNVELIGSSLIDQRGVVWATQEGFKLNLQKILKESSSDLFLLTDAFEFQGSLNSGIDTKAIIKGDSLSFSIAAAAILAKVIRDRYMNLLSQYKEYSPYLWGKNKGYGTKEHRTALEKLGSTKHHRKSFVKNYVAS